MSISFSSIFSITKINQKNENQTNFLFVFENNTYIGITKHTFIEEKMIYGGIGTLNKNEKRVYFESIFSFSPNTYLSAFINFLEYNKVPGITKKTIKILLKEYDERLIFIWQDEHFHQIQKTLFFTDNKIDIMKEKWKKIKQSLPLHLLLIKCGLSSKHIKKVYKIHKEDSLKIIKNPYSLIYSNGFGFKTADNIARECQFSMNHPLRIEGAILYAIKEEERLGNTCISFDNLEKKVNIIIKNNIHNTINIDIAVKTLAEKKYLLILNNNIITLPSLYTYEKYILDFFQKNKKNLNNFIDKNENINNFSDEQIHAIENAIYNQYSVITGPAGTGKSSIIKEIYSYQKGKNKKIIIVTPTGRASQRIQEIDITLTVSTIHKLLTWERIEQTKKGILIDYLDFDHIIVDESSMIDTQLLWILIKNTAPHTQITLIGDNQQLPPIGYGEPFNDIINNQILPISFLTKIFRQKKDMIDIAFEVAQGKVPKKLFLKKESLFIESNKTNLDKIIYEQIECHYNNETGLLEVQFITFLNRGHTGTIRINSLIQEYIQNKKKNNIKIWNKFYLHDLILVLKNNYKKEIRNGEIGIIIEIIMHDEESGSKIKVQFHNKKVVYFYYEDLEMLDLAYAINVYKSQGSEYKNIIVLIFMESFLFLNKKSFYTAITRTKKHLICIGEKKALYCSIKNKKNLFKNTIIKYFFNQLDQLER